MSAKWSSSATCELEGRAGDVDREEQERSDGSWVGLADLKMVCDTQEMMQKAERSLHTLAAASRDETEAESGSATPTP